MVNPSDDAHELKKGGALLPLGSDADHGSHKGYALGAIVDIFSGILSGANYAPWVPPFPGLFAYCLKNNPAKALVIFLELCGLMHSDLLTSLSNTMDDWIKGFRSAKTITGA